MNEKVYNALMNGKKDNNIRFSDLQKLLDKLGFKFRVKGDHFIYYRKDIPEIINIQPKGNKVKGYQVKQIRRLLIKYKI